MGFSIKKHLQEYNKQHSKPGKECTTCSADIGSGSASGHAELMKIKNILQTETKDIPEGYDVFILDCCAETAQDQVVFAITREFNYRDKASFATMDAARKIERITHQSPHIRFSLSRNCDTLTAAIDVPSANKIERAIPFADDYTDIVTQICEQYLSIVFQIKELKQTTCTA